MVNWIFAAALLAVASAAPQSYIVAPGHFHFEFGGQNEYKFTTQAPQAKAAPVPAPTPAPAPIIKTVTVPSPTLRTVNVPSPIIRTVNVPVPKKVPAVQPNPVKYVYKPKTVVSPVTYTVPKVQYVTQVAEPVTPKYVAPQVSRVSVPVSPAVNTVNVHQSVQSGQSGPILIKSNNDHERYAILRYLIDIHPYGRWNYAYETENGIKAEETGDLKNAGSQGEAEQAEGYYTYTGPDNVVYTVRYVADENGFHAEGAHLPTPPPIPEAIQKALEYLKTIPPRPDELL